MRRISIPDIPDTLANDLVTLESAKAWMKHLESVERRLEQELVEIRMALKYVVYPRYSKLEREERENESRNIQNSSHE